MGVSEMAVTQQQFINLLDNFKKSLQDNPYPRMEEINQGLDKVINNLHKKKLEGIALPIEVLGAVNFVNDFIAFGGLKLSPMQSNCWHQLKKATFDQPEKDLAGYDMFGSFIR